MQNKLLEKQTKTNNNALPTFRLTDVHNKYLAKYVQRQRGDLENKLTG